MKIGIYQSPFRRDGASFADQIRRMRSIGFEAMDFAEFTAYDVEEIFTLSASDFEKRLKEYARIAEDNGVEISQAHAPWKYPRAHQTKEELDLLVSRIEQSIEGTAMLNCPYLVVHPFLPYTSHDMQYEDETIDLNAKLLRRICDKADAFGIDLCLENMPMLRFSVGSVRRIISMTDVVDHKRLKICLDTGHCNVFEVKQSKAIRDIGHDRLKVLHIHDNHGAKDEHLFPFDGNIDWTDFALALKEIGYEGVFSLETGEHENLPDELLDGYLRDLYDRAVYIEKMTH